MNVTNQTYFLYKQKNIKKILAFFFFFFFSGGEICVRFFISHFLDLLFLYVFDMRASDSITICRLGINHLEREASKRFVIRIVDLGTN